MARNFILIGALLGIGAAAGGFYIMNSEAPSAFDTQLQNSDKNQSLTEAAVQLKEQAMAPRVLADVAPEGAVIPRKGGDQPRYTPLFMAPQLWKVGDGHDAVQDILRPDSKQIHAGVPNVEFYRYGMENIIGQPDALEIDSDDDGFSNAEEFAAKTDPSDKNSMPPFASNGVAKMLWTNIKEDKHTLILDNAYSFQSDISINVHDGAGSSMAPARSHKWANLKEGDEFGLSDKADEKGALSPKRFKVIAEGKDDKGAKYIEVQDSYALVEADKTFRLYPGSKQGHEVSDVEVSLTMTAGAQKGSALKNAVRLNESFDVPGFKGVRCTLTKASAKNPKSVIITLDGDSQPIKLKKQTTAKKNKQ